MRACVCLCVCLLCCWWYIGLVGWQQFWLSADFACCKYEWTWFSLCRARIRMTTSKNFKACARLKAILFCFAVKRKAYDLHYFCCCFFFFWMLRTFRTFRVILHFCCRKICLKTARSFTNRAVLLLAAMLSMCDRFSF